MIDKKILGIGMVLFMLVAVSAVAVVLFAFPYQPDSPPEADDDDSTQGGIQNVVDANNEFAFELYSELNRDNNGNVFYSPYSISAALAMTYEGAKGQTASEMQSVFHFPDSDILRPNFAAIYNGINSGDNAYELRTGNALWAQYDYEFLEDYTSRVEKYYGGKVANLDFGTETEKSRVTINDFIEAQTNGKIEDLIPKGMLNPLTRLVLTNAVYFKGTWEWEFDESYTYDNDFWIDSNSAVKVPMMHMKPEKASLAYLDTGELQMLELPYKGNEVSMLILLPSESIDDLESSLTLEKFEGWKSQMYGTMLDDIYLPKFEFDAKYSLNENLESLGMSAAFDPEKADFSGMTEKEKLFISSIMHQAYIKVDEKGTEAAAATVVVMAATSSAESRKVFRADHPFIFVIQEKATGNILFMGKVVDPSLD